MFFTLYVAVFFMVAVTYIALMGPTQWHQGTIVERLYLFFSNDLFESIQCVT